jgi:DNA ligase-1
MNSLPELYDISSTGKIKKWLIYVKKNSNSSEIITETGFIDGKIQTFNTEVKKGKNIGRANETTHFEQAVSQAKSKWNKQKDKGYSESIVTKKSNVILPMLALDYHKRGKDIKFPCFAQPKLDGIRAIFHSGALHSRMNKKFPNLDHLNNELKSLKYNLDGELYTDEISFQEISGIVRKKKLTGDDLAKLKKVKLRVYDIVSPLGYSDRYKLLQNIFKGLKSEFIKPVETIEIFSIVEIKPLHDAYVKKGYEGLMLRNKTGGYIQKNRSKDLQKFKEFDDDEFVIVDSKQGTGKDVETIIFACKTKKGNLFDVRPVGTYTQRAEMWKNRTKFVGKKLKVKYFGLTDNSDIPRHPVALEVRDMNY